MALEAIGTNIQPQNKTGGSGKAWCSVFIPGLGQFLDGRNKAGAIYMGTSIAAVLGTRALLGSAVKDVFRASETTITSNASSATKYLSKLSGCKVYGAVALGLAGAALWIANIVDAYKGNRKKA